MNDTRRAGPSGRRGDSSPSNIATTGGSMFSPGATSPIGIGVASAITAHRALLGERSVDVFGHGCAAAYNLVGDVECVGGLTRCRTGWSVSFLLRIGASASSGLRNAFPADSMYSAGGTPARPAMIFHHLF